MEVRRLGSVVQYVSDPETSTRWYARFLGIEPTPYALAYFKFGGDASLLLAPSAPGTGRGGSGVFFDVEDVDGAYRDRLAQGFRFNEEPYDIPSGRLVTTNDPDGNIVGFIDNSKGGLP